VSPEAPGLLGGRPPIPHHMFNPIAGDEAPHEVVVVGRNPHDPIFAQGAHLGGLHRPIGVGIYPEEKAFQFGSLNPAVLVGTAPSPAAPPVKPSGAAPAAYTWLPKSHRRCRPSSPSRRLLWVPDHRQVATPADQEGYSLTSGGVLT